MLEQQQPDHEPGGAIGPALVTEKKRRDLGIEPLPVESAGEQHQLVLHVDDLIESGAEQVAFARRHMLLWSQTSSGPGNQLPISPLGRLQDFGVRSPESLQCDFGVLTNRES